MARPEGHTLEDEGAKKKWDAWKREEGLSRTEAKRQYISYLINTMRVYASGTLEARELLGELEYLWDQIKDVEFSDEDRFYNVPQLVVLNIDQLDRFSTGTPWPMQSTYLQNFSQPQNTRSNLEQIYLHSRRNTQLSLNEYVRKGTASVYLMPARREQASSAMPASTLEDFRSWQGEINLIVNKLSKEFVTRKDSYSDSESEGDLDRRERLRRRVVHVLRVVGIQALHFAKNVSIALVAILFLVWCVKKNVVVQRTVVKQGGRKELVVNMVIPDENKWFVRLLNLVNNIVGFV